MAARHLPALSFSSVATKMTFSDGKGSPHDRDLGQFAGRAQFLHDLEPGLGIGGRCRQGRLRLGIQRWRQSQLVGIVAVGQT